MYKQDFITSPDTFSEQFNFYVNLLYDNLKKKIALWILQIYIPEIVYSVLMFLIESNVKWNRVKRYTVDN